MNELNLGRKTMSIEVYVINLGKYNEGKLVGEWIALPKSQEEIDNFLKNELGLELDSKVAFEKGMRGEVVYEEYAIRDWNITKDGILVDLNVHEYTPLRTLNAVAELLDKVDTKYIDLINQFHKDVETLSLENVASVLMNIYDKGEPDGVEDFRSYLDTNISDEAAYGEYFLTECDSEIYQTLKEYNVEEYFDCEEYGHNLADDGTLLQGWFIHGISEIYDWTENLDIDDIIKKLEERRESPSITDHQRQRPLSLHEAAQDSIEASKVINAETNRNIQNQSISIPSSQAR